MARASLLLLLPPLALIGCGGSGGGSGGVKAVTLTPSSARTVPGGLLAFTAVLDGGYRPVDWSVVELGGGTITAQGSYTAPARSGTFTVKAALKGDASKAGTARVVVDSGYTVNLVGPATIGAGKTATYTATLTGTSDARVTWTASGGAITPGGVLTAPATTGKITVTATSVADPGKSKSLEVTVAARVSVVSPPAGTLTLPGARLTFTALIDGAAASSGAVDWTATGGTVDANGKFIAPGAVGTYTITATDRSTGGSASATAEVAADLDATVVVEGRGTYVLDLRPDQAPNTCANFVSLIDESFYDGIIFHRYEPGFVIQWGDPLTKTLPLTDPSIGTGGPGYTIPFEANPLLNVRGSLAMARAQARDSGGSQVYVNLVDNPSLDGNYVVFGAVRSGLDVVDALRKGDKILSIRVSKP